MCLICQSTPEVGTDRLKNTDLPKEPSHASGRITHFNYRWLWQLELPLTEQVKMLLGSGGPVPTFHPQKCHWVCAGLTESFRMEKISTTSSPTVLGWELALGAPSCFPGKLLQHFLPGALLRHCKGWVWGFSFAHHSFSWLTTLGVAPSSSPRPGRVG